MLQDRALLVFQSPALTQARARSSIIQIVALSLPPIASETRAKLPEEIEGGSTIRIAAPGPITGPAALRR